MDHNKLIEESANIFGRSLVTPTTETSNLQERGAVGRVLRKVTGGARKLAGKLAGKVTSSNAEADAKAKRRANAQTASGLRKSWQSKTGDPNLSIDNRAAQIEHDAQVANPPKGGHDRKTGGAEGQALSNITARDEKAKEYMRKTGNAGQLQQDADDAEDEAEMARYKKKRQEG